MSNYFLDTYALIEIVKGNKNYQKFLDSEIFISIFNLYEFHFSLLRDYNEQTAKKFFNQFKNKVLKIKDEYIFGASKFKLQNRKQKLSYADCLGYMMALNNNMKFLTGDKEFENLKNVEFVK
ncbi:MAG: PIN domain-containing protein [Nanoarchaeota archaeon]|nr:PIN domain-containing protein [Nanoarchaeota archaeon]